MPLKTEIATHTLHFKFAAGTSRGVLREKTSVYLRISDREEPEVYGMGEAGPLDGLSPESLASAQKAAKWLAEELAPLGKPTSSGEVFALAHRLLPAGYPSLKFALETALLDLLHGGRRVIFNNGFSSGKKFVPVNGLIWMGDRGFMLKQIAEKLEAGFTCLKMKIGAIHFDAECKILEDIRREHGPHEISLRVDANGAFSLADALPKLHKLSHFQLHSIEQPVTPGQLDALRELCRTTPVPIALDEELIGVEQRADREALLDATRPQYVVLKPTLLGGLAATREWIELATDRGIGWWITSALESNIGLNAIAQLASEYHYDLPQGLGTGLLYHNNIVSPLYINHGSLNCKPTKEWDFGCLKFEK